MFKAYLIGIGFGAILSAGCSSDGSPKNLRGSPDAGEIGDDGSVRDLYTIDLQSSGFNFANTTLLFPLGLAASRQTPTVAEPGDFVVRNTRVGCWIEDPAPVIGTVALRAVSPVRLSTLAVTLSVAAHPSAVEPVCFAYRSQDGVWHGLLQPTQMTRTPALVTSGIDIDVDGVNAAAIFLPTYSTVTSVSYRASGDQ